MTADPPLKTLTAGSSNYQLARATKKLQAAGVITKLRKVQGALTQHRRVDQAVFL